MPVAVVLVVVVALSPRPIVYGQPGARKKCNGHGQVTQPPPITTPLVKPLLP